MKSNQNPNFYPKAIAKSITNLTKDGYKSFKVASKGSDWDSVVALLDESEHLIGRQMSVNSHLNAVLYSDDFNQEYEKTLPIISNYYSDLGASEDLYNAFIELKIQSLMISRCTLLKTLSGLLSYQGLP